MGAKIKAKNGKLWLYVLLVLGRLASAQTIQKWQTPDGKLYFGDKPPAGSKLVGRTGTLGTSGGGDVKKAPASPAKSAEQRTGSYSCDGVSIKDTQTETSESGRWQAVSGIVENTGRTAARDVKLCAADVCQIAASVLEPGQSQNFWIDTSHMVRRGPFTLTVECSTPTK